MIRPFGLVGDEYMDVGTLRKDKKNNEDDESLYNYDPDQYLSVQGELAVHIHLLAQLRSCLTDAKETGPTVSL